GPIAVRWVLRGGRRAVAKCPTVDGDRSVRVAACARKVAGEQRATGREVRHGRPVDGHALRGAVRRPLIVSHSERNRIGPAGPIAVRWVLRGGRRAVSECPTVAGDRPVGVAVGVRKVAGEEGVIGREVRHGRPVDGHALRGAVRRPLIVSHSERNRIGPAGPIAVRWVLRGGRRAVAKCPTVAGDRPIGIAARARKVAGEQVAALREPCDWWLIRYSDSHVLGSGIRCSYVVRYVRRRRLTYYRVKSEKSAQPGARTLRAELPSPLRIHRARAVLYDALAIGPQRRVGHRSEIVVARRRRRLNNGVRHGHAIHERPGTNRYRTWSSGSRRRARSRRRVVISQGLRCHRGHTSP